MSNQVWQELLNTLEIQPDGNLFPISEEEILTFESKSGLKLPEDYREFCKLFGSGRFGDIDIIGSYLDSLIADVDKIAVKTWHEGDRIDDNELDELIAMLDTSFRFAGGGNNNSFYIDSSHNVYALYFGSLIIYVYNFGFGFTSFILDYCLSKEFQQSLPEEWRNESEISKIFYAIQ